MKFARWFLMSFLAIGVADAAQSVRWNEMPPATQATISRQARGGRVTRLRREFDHGRWVYEARVKYPGRLGTTRIGVDPRGNVVRIR